VSRRLSKFCDCIDGKFVNSVTSILLGLWQYRPKICEQCYVVYLRFVTESTKDLWTVLRRLSKVCDRVDQRSVKNVTSTLQSFCAVWVYASCTHLAWDGEQYDEQQPQRPLCFVRTVWPQPVRSSRDPKSWCVHDNKRWKVRTREWVTVMLLYQRHKPIDRINLLGS
jgi:hypothetical protein